MHMKSDDQVNPHAGRIPIEHYLINTGNGPVTVTEEVLVQLQARGVTKPIAAQRGPEVSMNLTSMGKMVVDEGFSFYWTHCQQPRLVIPQGKRVWLEVEIRSPVFNTRELVVNKTNELEAYGRINAAKSQTSMFSKHRKLS